MARHDAPTEGGARRRKIWCKGLKSQRAGLGVSGNRHVKVPAEATMDEALDRFDVLVRSKVMGRFFACTGRPFLTYRQYVTVLEYPGHAPSDSYPPAVHHRFSVGFASQTHRESFKIRQESSNTCKKSSNKSFKIVRNRTEIKKAVNKHH